MDNNKVLEDFINNLGSPGPPIKTPPQTNTTPTNPFDLKENMTNRVTPSRPQSIPYNNTPTSPISNVRREETIPYHEPMYESNKVDYMHEENKQKIHISNITWVALIFMITLIYLLVKAPTIQ